MNKALILKAKQDDGCTWYRLTQFASKAKELGLIDAQFLDLTLSEENLQKVVKEADIFLARLDQGIELLFPVFEAMGMNKPLIIDIDDVFENLDPASNSYEKLGIEEVKLADGRYLWQDGRGGFNLAENKQRVNAYTYLMGRATAIIVTTARLRDYALRFNPNVVIIPNAIDPKLFPQVKALDKAEDEVRLTWAGGSSHMSDLAEIKPVLKEIMEKYPQVTYYHVGQYFEGIVKDLPKDRVKLYGWIKADGHGYRMACINADIGICPIQDIDFNTYKSSIKFYEYSAVNTATIARGISPYTDDIKHGETGLLYNNNDELYKCLEELINDASKRTTMAHKAREYVLANRELSQISTDWAEFLKGVIKAWNSQ